MERLTICTKNKVYRIGAVYTSSYPFNSVLQTIVLARASYRACIDYEGHHACNMIPVMIGTETEARLTHSIYETFVEMGDGDDELVLEEYKCLDLRQKLRGFCVDDGHLGVLPSLIMNNREKIHNYTDRNMKNCRVLYMYNFMDRGSVLKLWDGKAMLFRDQNGDDHVGPASQFSSKTVIGVSDEYTVCTHDWLKLNLETKTLCHIDSFRNKIILTPAVIMYRVLMRCRNPQNVAICRTRIAAGHFHFFLSQTATFQMSHSYHGSNMLESFTDSNLIRRPMAHQIGATYDHFFQITRVSKPHLKMDQPFPSMGHGFLCPYYFSSNISNFSKTLSLVEDVVVNFKTINVIESIMRHFDELCTTGEDGRGFSVTRMELADAKIIPGHVIVQEVVATIFRVEGDMKRLLIHLKYKFDSAMEMSICPETGRVYVSSIAGTAMKMTPSEIWGNAPGDKALNFSATELAYFFPEYYTSNSFPIHSVPAKVLKPYTAYEEPTKSITTASQLRNKLLTDSHAELFNFSNEITGTYLGCGGGSGGSELPQFRNSRITCDRAVAVQPNGSFKLKTLICSDLNLNEDAYVFNERLNFNVLIKQKYNISLPFSTDDGDKLVLERNQSGQYEPQIVYKYDPVSGAPILITFILGTLYTRKEFNCVMIYKLNLLKIDKNVYLLYRQSDQSDLLQQTNIRASTVVYPSQNSGNQSRVFWKNPPADAGGAAEPTIYVYLHLEYRLPYYSGFKICNYSGQKGICNFKNLSRYAINGVEPDALISAISIVGRKPLPQLKEMAHYPVAVDAENPNKIIAETTYFALRNRAMDMAISCNIKIDNLTAIVMSMNNLNYCLYAKSQDAQLQTNHSPIASQLRWVGQMYAPIGKGLIFDDRDFDDAYQKDFTNAANCAYEKCMTYWSNKKKCT